MEPMRILIADDDGVSRALLEAILKYWGHEVVTTTDGLEAHQALQRDDAPSFAILDWLMPGLDGPEVCRKLRKLPNPKPLYILLLTVKDQRADIISGLEAGADDYVTKPFDQGELKARILAG
ncbi:MAG TPA: response regulator, partial [Candidatus Polarisedimenticolia bacterium]